MVPPLGFFIIVLLGITLGVHKHYFGSDYYKKQNYLPHYSQAMRRLIGRQGKGA
jgi:hypothetical protein